MSQPSPQTQIAQPASTTSPAPAPAPAQPAQAPQATPTPTVPPIIATSALPPQTFREKLRAGDAHWQWQLGLRAITVITGLIGIGCTAWAVSKYTHSDFYTSYDYELEDTWAIPWGLITFTISVIWSSICILVFFLRRPNAPVHPGVRVGIDLILWLAFIPTALFAVVAVMSVMDWGSDGILGYYSSSGYYYYVPGNNTWVWNATEYDSYSSRSRDCTYSSSYRTFSSCTEEDAYVNSLWKEKDKRFNTEMTACVCQFIGLVLHLALFIWACVNTHRRNSRKVSVEAEKLAADIVMNMVKNGAIVQAPGAAQMRPMAPQMMPQMQMYPQQYQPYPQQRGPPQQFPTPPQAASSSNEKSAGPRYA